MSSGLIRKVFGLNKKRKDKKLILPAPFFVVGGLR